VLRRRRQQEKRAALAARDAEESQVLDDLGINE
jgi:hypothetical protein